MELCFQEYLNVVPTGIKQLDKEDYLRGGFWPGDVYTIGGEPGAGKTAVALLLADRIARTGKDVIYFALTESRRELQTRSVSRSMAEIGLKQGIEQEQWKTTSDLLNGRVTKDDELFSAAVNKYFGDTKGHLNIVELNGGIEEIENELLRHNEFRDNQVVVIVDYLQVLDIKDSTEKTLRRLKQIAREYEVPIIALSGEYIASDTVKQFSDVVMFLDPLEDADYERLVRLAILKDKFNSRFASVIMKYLPAYNLFLMASDN